MPSRKQHGQIIRIGDGWYVRYWERRNTGGTVERKRVTQRLGAVTTRGKRPPADIEKEAERHMATVNAGAVPAERIVTIGDFVERVYLPWIEQHKRPSTAKGYRDIWKDHLKPHCAQLWLKDTRTYHVQGWLNRIGMGSLTRSLKRSMRLPQCRGLLIYIAALSRVSGAPHRRALEVLIEKRIVLGEYLCEQVGVSGPRVE
jgi:hypothetical protein